MPPMHLFRTPLEVLLLESGYFLAIFVFCAVIYFSTSELYRLSKHRGIYHFRNIFLYFGFAYLFRLAALLIPLMRSLFGIRLNGVWIALSFLFTSYFSTMAVFSVGLSMVKEKKHSALVETIMNIFAVVLSIMVFATRRQGMFLMIQAVIFIAAIIYSNIKSKKKVWHNQATYSLLFLFWVLNIFIDIRGVFTVLFRIILYIVSAVLFCWITVRVLKRLKSGKKA